MYSHTLWFLVARESGRSYKAITQYRHIKLVMVWKGLDSSKMKTHYYRLIQYAFSTLDSYRHTPWCGSRKGRSNVDRWDHGIATTWHFISSHCEAVTDAVMTHLAFGRSGGLVGWLVGLWVWSVWVHLMKKATKRLCEMQLAQLEWDCMVFIVHIHHYRSPTICLLSHMGRFCER